MMRTILLCLLLVACKPTVRPDAPKPPEVACTQRQTADVPAWPSQWASEGVGYAIAVLGLLEEERAMRALEHGCIAGLKARGVIR